MVYYFDMQKTLDFLAIGDITTDAFIRLSQAHVVDSIDHHGKELCMSFGDKIPYDSVEIVRGVGNSANAAVSAAKLGLTSAILTNVGDDQNGKECIGALADQGVSVDYVHINQGIETNYHYVLWYGEERTILVKHHDYDYKMPAQMLAPRWIYLSSMAENSLLFHQEVAEYVAAHPESKLVFQPGTFQMKLGTEKLAEIYKHSEVFFCNVEEARLILKTETDDKKELIAMLHALGPKVVVVTDGILGAYASDGTDIWFMPVYPHQPVERTGAGDAFASTFTSALALGKTVEEALLWAPINSMSVVQQVGAQKGLLTREQLADFLTKAPTDFKPKKI